MKFPDEEPLISFTYNLRSRYSETDKMGYVYYGRYLEYFEQARTELVRETGFPYNELEEQGIMLPVIHAELDYKMPVFYDELMQIEVLIHEWPMVKLDTYYRVLTERTGQSHVNGRVTLCFMNEKNRRPRRVPEAFLERLMQYKEKVS